MRRTTIAYINSSRDLTKRYVVIQRGEQFECSCLDFFFKENRDNPCRHIRSLLKSTFVPKVKVAASVHLTPRGESILRKIEQASSVPDWYGSP